MRPRSDPCMPLRRWCAISAALVVVLLGSTGAAQGGAQCDYTVNPDPFARPLDDRFVFRTVKVSGDGKLFYDVSVAACGRPQCPIEVRLRDGLATYDVDELDVCAAPVELVTSIRGATLNMIRSIGDPISLDRYYPIWFLRNDSNSVALFVRPIHLARDLDGIMIHVQGGWPLSSRRHYLFAAIDGTLVLAWVSPRDRDKGRFSIDVRDIDGDGSSEILYFYGVNVFEIAYQFDGRPSSRPTPVEAAVYRWNPARREVERLSVGEAGVPVYAVVTGQFASTVEAWAPWPDGAWCPPPPYLVPTDAFPGFEPGKFMFVEFSWRKQRAADWLEGFTLECASFDLPFAPFIAELADFPLPGRDQPPN